MIPEGSHIYKSIDKVVDKDDAVHYPVEFLNSLESSSILPHNLELKKGIVIMLLRNLDQPKLRNGTCMVVTELQPHIIKAKFLTGCDSKVASVTSLFSKSGEITVPNSMMSTDEHGRLRCRMMEEGTVSFEVDVNHEKISKRH
ncbi:uncharacterized protein LOC128248375 [Octopus bimaculoides]|uniref:uncharacterized protein LOC128248375 n=1 Tax=Octopus bimaculoides TaxID=37653 RepID=UPI0022E17DC2|nr:uncharacterized protein LOC128248375 [Octopus bimaculoides]